LLSVWPACRGPIDEALRVLAKGLIESVLASEVDSVGLAVMNLVWGHQADPEVVMVLIVPIKIIAQEASGILDAAEARGNCGWYFKFLNWLSENGLSLDVCGRLCERVTPRSASSSAVALAFIGAPRSACSVSWPYGTRCFASPHRAMA